jgi:hypothetical protein
MEGDPGILRPAEVAFDMIPDLDFTVLGAAPVPFCVVPTLAIKLGITAAGDEPIQAIALDCQVRIEAQKRRYEPGEKGALFDLFGSPAEWSRTLRSLLWTHASGSVPGFTGDTEFDLRVQCTYDFNVIAARYFHALEGGDVPLLLLFSGSVFFSGDQGQLQIGRISWNKEAACPLPVKVWKDLMEIYYPNIAWLAVERDLFNRLAAFKSARGLPTWERAIEALLAEAQEPAER